MTAIRWRYDSNRQAWCPVAYVAGRVIYTAMIRDEESSRIALQRIVMWNFPQARSSTLGAMTGRS